jgi:ABC-type dipeptide/oligopeptide/nickel transport system ATPase component
MTVDVLRVRDLRVRYHTPRGTVKAVEEVSYRDKTAPAIHPTEIANLMQLP